MNTKTTITTSSSSRGFGRCEMMRAIKKRSRERGQSILGSFSSYLIIDSMQRRKRRRSFCALILLLHHFRFFLIAPIFAVESTSTKRLTVMTVIDGRTHRWFASSPTETLENVSRKMLFSKKSGCSSHFCSASLCRFPFCDHIIVDALSLDYCNRLRVFCSTVNCHTHCTASLTDGEERLPGESTPRRAGPVYSHSLSAMFFLTGT
jgi:hypothetical protein